MHVIFVGIHMIGTLFHNMFVFKTMLVFHNMFVFNNMLVFDNILVSSKTISARRAARCRGIMARDTAGSFPELFRSSSSGTSFWN